MYLKQIQTFPAKFFRPVKFKNGINIVFGKKERATGAVKKNSLNGIGKSAFLDLISFALLAEFKNHTLPRLVAAKSKGILTGVVVQLDFEVEGKDYSIKRGFDAPEVINFCIKGKAFKQIKVTEFAPDFCNLIFQRPEYAGLYMPEWFSNLKRFFIKIQTAGRNNFSDPITFIKGINLRELIQYHFFLLNIDNSLACQNHAVQSSLNLLAPAVDKIKETILHMTNSKDIEHAQDKIVKLQEEIDQLSNNLSQFQLKSQYQSSEIRANQLTSEIKQLWLQNAQDRRTLDVYKQDFSYQINIQPNRIKQMYDEFNLLMGEPIKKELDQAVKFHKSLSLARKDFFKTEIEALDKAISQREKEIDEKELERRTIFQFLSATKAFTDYTKAVEQFNSKKDAVSKLLNNLEYYNSLMDEKHGYESRENEIDIAIPQFLQAISSQLQEFSDLLHAIYNNIYPNENPGVIFEIEEELKYKAKFKIKVLNSNEMLSSGRNSGRIILYDLAVILFAIKQKYKIPHFLIHDGAFADMDKEQFIRIYEFIEKQSKAGKKFQYIVSMNEEGTLNEKFGNADAVNPVKLDNESLISLSQNRPLFKTRF